MNVITIIEGLDLTKELSITKYIPPAIGGGSSFGQMCSKGDFPTHLVSKTDETNVCSKTRALEEIQGMPVYITLKIEGSSLTTTYNETELMVCSRNNQIVEHETNKFWNACKKYNLQEKLKATPDLVLQGELYGEGVQRNHLGIQGVDLAVFNVIDKQTRIRLTFDEMKDVCQKIEVPMVQVVFETDSFDWDFDTLQEFTDKQTYPNGSPAEGVIVRPKTPFYSKILKEDFSIKNINRDYKL